VWPKEGRGSRRDDAVDHTCRRNIGNETISGLTHGKVYSQITLFHGDNLDILNNCIPTTLVDLNNLDPSINSNANYNVLFS